MLSPKITLAWSDNNRESNIQKRLVLMHTTYNKLKIYIHITCQIILSFWLVPTYDLLENRRIDNVINSFFLLCHSLFPCVCSVTDHRIRRKVVRTSGHTRLNGSCRHFFVLPTFWRGLWWQHGIYSALSVEKKIAAIENLKVSLHTPNQ